MCSDITLRRCTRGQTVRDGERWHPGQLLLGLPGVLTLLLVLMGAVPIGAPLLGPVLPAFGLVAVFVFSIYRPDLMPHWLAFLVGLVQDLVIGGPLGLNALLLLSVQGLCSSQRRFSCRQTVLAGLAGFLARVAAGRCYPVADCLCLSGCPAAIPGFPDAGDSDTGAVPSCRSAAHVAGQSTGPGGGCVKERIEKARYPVFTRRAVVLGAAKAGLFGLLASRLYYLQVMKPSSTRCSRTRTA